MRATLPKHPTLQPRHLDLDGHHVVRLTLRLRRRTHPPLDHEPDNGPCGGPAHLVRLPGDSLEYLTPGDPLVDFLPLLPQLGLELLGGLLVLLGMFRFHFIPLSDGHMAM